ncbi:MAG: hypothetical protein WDW38_006878 [Sanguina aurantia]
MQTAIRTSVSRVSTARISTPRRLNSVRVMSSFYELSAKDQSGKEVSMKKYEGKVVVITNVACYCGYTSGNYKELQSLYAKYKDQGLEVVAFPCNQFGAQEPGSAAEIKDFTEKKFGVEFDIYDKIDVNGPKTHPVYKFLKAQTGCDGDVNWNFAAKFIIDKQGNVVQRNGDNPMKSEPLLKTLLAA